MISLLDVVTRSLGRVFLNFAEVRFDNPFHIWIHPNVNAVRISLPYKDGNIWEFQCFYPIFWEAAQIEQKDFGKSLRQIFEEYSIEKTAYIPSGVKSVTIPRIGIKIATSSKYDASTSLILFGEIIQAWKKDMETKL